MSVPLLAAHGLTAAMARTWSPSLARTPRVLVPVQLDVMMVRDEKTWARTAMQVPSESDVSHRSLLPEPFSELSEPRPSGAYLHWALPDALTRGQQVPVDRNDPEGAVEAEFPAVPDRWLVLRLSPSASGAGRAVRGWVLRAGDELPVVVPLDEWVESDARRGDIEQPLTVLGHGDPAFTAYFDNVQDRLSFYDALDDVAAGPIAYLVCGWFADPKLDPIASADIASLAAFDRRIAELEWRTPAGELQAQLAEAVRTVRAARDLGLHVEETALSASVSFVPDAPTVWPTQTLYHGSVVGIGWPDALQSALSQEIGGPPSASDISIAVGATTGEAVAALVAKHRPQLDDALIEAYYAGLLSQLEHPGARGRIDARLHRLEFGSISGGTTSEWIWQSGSEPERPSIFTHPSTAVASAPLAVAAHHSGLADASQPTVGGLREVLNATTAPIDTSGQPSGYVEVTRALPRFFFATDPVLLLSGAHRSERHGGDGRFDPEHRLACRTSGGCVRALSIAAVDGATPRPTVRGHELLERRIDNGSVPSECQQLLEEIALLDPGSAKSAARVVLERDGSTLSDDAVSSRAARFAVEQTVWWALRDRAVHPASLLRHSGLAGTLPSPLAVTPPRQPWTPVHAEYEIELRPANQPRVDWSIDEIDLELQGSAPRLDQPIVIRGRSLMTAAAARSLASRARQTLSTSAAIGTATELAADHVPRFASDVARDLLEAAGELKVALPHPRGDDRPEDIADAIEDLDLLTGSLEGLRAQLSEALGDADVVAGGSLRVTRLRLVDGFGQLVDLIGDDTRQPVTWSRRMQLDDEASAGELRPRFLEPARILLRYMDGESGSEEAGTYGDSPEQLRSVSPLCGFIVPNHLDSSLQCFAADGHNLGSVSHGDDAALIWEDAPGRPTLVGQTPRRAIANPFLGAMADELVGLGKPSSDDDESALTALLRLIDATMWSVDPFAWSADDQVGLLLGQPIAVMRARVRLELGDPRDVEADPSSRAEWLASMGPMPLRLGALTQPGDGLLGYFVHDDYRKLHACDRASTELAREIGPNRGFLQRVDLVDPGHGASPIVHPYVDPHGVVWVQPGQDVDLTLLMEPYAAIHVTMGALPRKKIGMRRRWLEAGLAHISPTFRFGPVLVDPAQIRMPVPSASGGAWSWSHRAAVGQWDDATIVQATEDATMSDDPAVATEGWLTWTRDDRGRA
jgi:hypothetical protein